jgi:hypothetical protein
MNRSCYLTWVIFLAVLVLNADAQQSAPAGAPAPPPLVGNARGASGLARGEEPERCGHRGSPCFFAL